MAGLGNPGPAYEKTRHNAGFWFIEALALSLQVSFRRPFFKKYLLAEKHWDQHSIYLIKPLSFMNLSGSVVVPFLRKKGLSSDDLFVAVDQMDLEPGRARLKPKGSNAGHNGLKSLESWLESSEYRRLYLGIGRPRAGGIIDHVLGIPSPQEDELIRSRIQESVESFLKVFSEGWEPVQNEINSRSLD